MNIAEIDGRMDAGKREYFLDCIAGIDKAAFGKSAWGRESFAENVKNGYDFLIVAAKAPEGSETMPAVAGYALLRVLDDAELIMTAVDMPYRRKGIGRAMVERLKDEARKRGAGHIFLEVRSNNTAARALYDSAGFEACGVRKGYYQGPRDDAVIMRYTC